MRRSASSAVAPLATSIVIPSSPNHEADTRPGAKHLFSAMVGMARRAVPARVVAGETNNRAALAFKGTAPLCAARTSHRDVPSAPEKALGWSGGSPLPRGGEPYGIEP